MFSFDINISFVSDLIVSFTYGNKKAMTVKIPSSSIYTSFITQRLVFQKVQFITILMKRVSKYTLDWQVQAGQRAESYIYHNYTVLRAQ